jgi:hypothetical protein
MNHNSTAPSGIRRVDQVTLSRNLNLFLVFIATVIIAGYAVKSGNPIIMLGFVAMPFVFMLMNRPELTFALAVILDASSIDIPGVSFTSVGVLAKLILLGAFTLAVALGQRMWKGDQMAERRPMVLFLGNILLLMAVRGSGLRMLGSATWGGMMYVNFIIGLLFFMALNGLIVKKKQIRWIIWGSLIAGALGSIFQYRGWSSVELSSEVTASRLNYLAPVTIALLSLGIAIKTRVRLIRPLLVLLCLVLVALSGFRSRWLGTVMVCAGFGFFMSRDKVRYFVVLALLGLVGWGCIVAASPHLPLGIQRAVSFLPGVQVEQRVAMNALESIEWRVEIWKYCLEKVPEYFWIGRGSAFDVGEASANLSSHDIGTFSPWFAFQTRSYHSGPLSLLLDYGITGFVTGIWLMVLMFKRFWKAAVELSLINTFEARYTLFLTVYLLWRIFAYFFVYGDIRAFSLIISDAAIAMVLYSSVKRMHQARVEAIASASLVTESE